MGTVGESWEEPPERIEACMSCCLADCYPEHFACNLKAVGHTTKHRPVKVKTSQPRQNTKISAAIISAGHTVHQWCQDHGIKYDQLIRFEKTPPKQPTRLSLRIGAELEKSGIKTCE